jgi:hypothetical protein
LVAAEAIEQPVEQLAEVLRQAQAVWLLIVKGREPVRELGLLALS